MSLIWDDARIAAESYVLQGLSADMQCNTLLGGTTLSTLRRGQYRGRHQGRIEVVFTNAR